MVREKVTWDWKTSNDVQSAKQNILLQVSKIKSHGDLLCFLKNMHHSYTKSLEETMKFLADDLQKRLEILEGRDHKKEVDYCG